MIKITFQFLALSALIITAQFASAYKNVASAEESQIFITPGTDFQNHGNNVREFLKQQSFSTTNKEPAGNVNLSIVRPDFLEEDQFGLLFSKMDSTTSCYEFSPLEYEANYIQNLYLDIKLKHYRRNLKETQHPEYDCDTKNKMITGMIVLSAKDLAAKGVRQIRFSNGSGITDNYNVSVTPDRVRLTPESMVAFKAKGLQGADQTYIEYRFADNNLITLQVPMAENGEDIMQAVRNLAYKSTLQPVFEREGIDTSGANNVFYFLDPNGSTAGQMGEDGFAEFGTINVMRPYDGPNGRVSMPVPLKVFLAKPNMAL